MSNHLAQFMVWWLMLTLFVALVIKLGWPTALLIAFSLSLVIPSGTLSLLIGFIALSLNMTLLAYALKYWPITLLLCLISIIGHQSETKHN